MRYIFVFLILANVVLLAFVFYDKDSEHTKEAPVTNSKQQVVELDEKESVAEQSINEASYVTPASDTQQQKGDSALITVNSIEDGSNKLSIGTIELAKPKTMDVALQSNTVWQCLIITSDTKPALEKVDEQYQLDANIVAHKTEELRSTMVYIGAKTPQEANQLRARVIQLNLVKDPYISRYQEEPIISVGVFRSENSIKNIKNIFAPYPEFNLQLRPLYQEKTAYKITLQLPEQSAASLVDEAVKMNLATELLKSEKDCN